MTTGEEVRQAIRNLIAQYLVTTKLREPKMCTVLSVSANTNNGLMTCDCRPVDGTAVVEDVKLVTYYNNNKAGFVLVPKVNSRVQIVFNDECDAFVGMVSEVDFIYLNGNSYGGLVQVQPLVDKLNALEDRLNKIINAFATWTPVANDGGAALKAQISLALLTQVIETQKTDLENTTVQHGTGSLS